jgi:hypothetical protein
MKRAGWGSIAAATILSLALAGCGTTVIGHCELPAALDAPLDNLPDIPTDKPIPRDQADQIWANDRAHDAKAVSHNNQTVQFVKDHCQ